MIAFLRSVFHEYVFCFSNRRYRLSALVAIIVFLSGVFIASSAITYNGTYVSNSVTDIILSNTRVYDVDGMFVYGGVVLVIFSTLIVLLYPRKIPFVGKCIGLFYVIRSGFVLLTHISPFPQHVDIATSYFTTSALFKTFFTGSDLFFSAHTGLPFILACIFWESLPLRITFICLSILFGTVVLLGHLHYSIDVAAAFFIVPTIYRIAVYVFKADYDFGKTSPVVG